MNVADLIQRHPPQPWIDGEKIPWDEPGFSARMLREHLSQQHDAASRRFTLIDRHVAWIHTHILNAQPAHILDLGCGPGLYLWRLAQLGHVGTGIDFSPASLAYARSEAARAGLTIAYRQQDLRRAVFAAGEAGHTDLVMLLFGEFNTFRKRDARAILNAAYTALRPGGRLLLEPSTFAAVEDLGKQAPSWYSAPQGLWSDRPHLCLQDNAWDAAQAASVERYALIDGASGEIVQYAITTQAYPQEELTTILTECGFCDVTIYPSLLGMADADHAGLYAVLACKPAL